MTSGVHLDRVPPQNIDAERSVLGSILVTDGERELLAEAVRILGDGEAFYREAHRKIYEAILDLYETGSAITLITVSERLEAKGVLERVGGVAYLDQMMDSTPSAPTAHVIEYEAGIVLEEHTRRRIIHMAADAYNEGFDNTESSDEVLAKLEKQIFDVRNERPLEGPRPVKALIKPVFRGVQDRYTKGEKITGLASGFMDLDDKTSGFSPGDYIMVAGRPSMGKSTFVQDIARYAAMELRVPVLFFSLEMADEGLVLRLLSAASNISAGRVRSGKLSESDWPKITIGAGNLSESPIWIDASKPNMKPLELRARAHMVAHKTEIGLIIIDYIQLMQPDGKIETRNAQLTQISGALKALGRELNVPLIAVSQLSRAPEGRPDKRPQLSDLRESGSLEQDADLVLMLYREKYYKHSTRNDVAEVIIAKQRNGPTAVVRLLFDSNKICFRNLQQHEAELFEREPGEDG